MNPGFFQRRRMLRDSKALVRETRRILRKRGWRIAPDKVREISERADALRDAVRARDWSSIPRELGRLDGIVDQHLAFARKSTLREYAESVGTAVLIALLLRSFVVEAFKIPSGSMIPTLEVGDHIFVSKFIYDFRKPERGDVIVFKYPPNPSIDYVKRVVAVAGDRVEIKAGRVWVNGSTAAAGEADCPSGAHWACNGPTIVPQDHVFVMGDNRNDSEDSRFWGFVPLKLIKGEALVVWYSPHLSRIGHVIH
jgi:signal peptidase I